MTTIERAMPLAVRMGGMGARTFSAARRIAAEAAFQPRRERGIHDLSDWILNDIGLERVDTMSPEARRMANRLSHHSLW